MQVTVVSASLLVTGTPLLKGGDGYLPHDFKEFSALLVGSKGAMAWQKGWQRKSVHPRAAMKQTEGRRWEKNVFPDHVLKVHLHPGAGS